MPGRLAAAAERSSRRAGCVLRCVGFAPSLPLWLLQRSDDVSRKCRAWPVTRTILNCCVHIDFTWKWKRNGTSNCNGSIRVATADTTDGFGRLQVHEQAKRGPLAELSFIQDRLYVVNLDFRNLSQWFHTFLTWETLTLFLWPYRLFLYRMSAMMTNKHLRSAHDCSVRAISNTARTTP